MSKMLGTPRSRIKTALRRMWLQSRERNQAIKDANRSCTKCGRHASVAKGREVKIVAHHTKGINWDGLVDLIIERLLQSPSDYTVLCEECHHEHHDNEPVQATFL